jgi:hypothetical protein
MAKERDKKPLIGVILCFILFFNMVVPIQVECKKVDCGEKTESLIPDFKFIRLDKIINEGNPTYNEWILYVKVKNIGQPIDFYVLDSESYRLLRPLDTYNSYGYAHWDTEVWNTGEVWTIKVLDFESLPVVPGIYHINVTISNDLYQTNPSLIINGNYLIFLTFIFPKFNH